MCLMSSETEYCDAWWATTYFVATTTVSEGENCAHESLKSCLILPSVYYLPFTFPYKESRVSVSAAYTFYNFNPINHKNKLCFSWVCSHTTIFNLVYSVLTSKLTRELSRERDFQQFWGKNSSSKPFCFPVWFCFVWWYLEHYSASPFYLLCFRFISFRPFYPQQFSWETAMKYAFRTTWSIYSQLKY